jgi:hypothetical protein
MEIVFDSADPDRLATFWAAALHYKTQDPPSGAEVDRIVRLGARQARTVEERGGYFVNMFDPEGNEFRRSLARGRGRLQRVVALLGKLKLA